LDTFSGSPFGFYLSSYLWLFFAARGFKEYLQVHNPLLIMLFLVLGVCIQHALFFAIFALSQPDSQIPAFAARSMVYQILWAVVTGPLILVVFVNSEKRVANWTHTLFAKKDNTV
jgi:cell shape-determining protein MreD